MVKKIILILGAKGMLGTALVKYLKQNKQFEVLTHSQTSDADFNHNLLDRKSVSDMLLAANVDFCVNLFALTDVNQCESDKAKAHDLNVLPVKNIVQTMLSANLDLKLIQISTDHVYDRKEAAELDIKLVNYYAITKFIADEISQLVDGAVLRTNFFGKSLSGKVSFSDWVLSNLQEQKKINGFSDVYFSPLHLDTLVGEIERVILNFVPGIYNLGSNRGFSKYDFMLELAKHKGFSDEYILPQAYHQANIPIPRPLDMRMNNSKYERTYKVTLPTLAMEIQKC